MNLILTESVNNFLGSFFEQPVPTQKIFYNFYVCLNRIFMGLQTLPELECRYWNNLLNAVLDGRLSWDELSSNPSLLLPTPESYERKF